MRHDGTSSDNYIISDSGITENDAIGSNKNVVSDSNNAYLSMSPGFPCTCIVCKYPYIAGQHNIVSNRNQPWPICIYRVATIVFKILSCGKPVSKAIIHCRFLRRCPPRTIFLIMSIILMPFSSLQSNLQRIADTTCSHQTALCHIEPKPFFRAASFHLKWMCFHYILKVG